MTCENGMIRLILLLSTEHFWNSSSNILLDAPLQYWIYYLNTLLVICMSLHCTFVQLRALIHQANVRAVGERLWPVFLQCVLHRWHNAALVCSFLANWAQWWKSHSDWPFSKANQCTGRETWKKGKAPSLWLPWFHPFSVVSPYFSPPPLSLSSMQLFLSDSSWLEAALSVTVVSKTLLYNNSIYQQSFSVSFEWHI